MRQTNTAAATAPQTERCGILLVNLGTPEAPTPAALRRYLAEFLADPRVIELPRAFWLPILYGVILPFRSPRSARAYGKVWTPEGSPLRVHSERLATALQLALDGAGLAAEVRLAMRYGSPSIADTLRDWAAGGLRRLLVVPLYPQYSGTTTGSVFDAVADALNGMRWVPELRFVNDYCDQPAWVAAVAESIRAHWQRHGRGDRLLFSLHGIPARYVTAGDPYAAQCERSAAAIAAALDLPGDAWTLSYQSRVGRETWLQPYTAEVVPQLARAGVRRLDVVCPGFAVDCIETLEEIAMETAEAFVEAGGETLRYVPALNDQPAHCDALAALIRRHAAGWPEFAAGEGRA